MCCVTQLTCLPSHTADKSAVSHSRHVCCPAQQTCLLCHTADMPAVSHSRHVCCGTQQTCLQCHTADMSAVSQSRRVCCVTQLNSSKKRNYLFGLPRTPKFLMYHEGEGHPRVHLILVHLFIMYHDVRVTPPLVPPPLVIRRGEGQGWPHTPLSRCFFRFMYIYIYVHIFSTCQT